MQYLPDFISEPHQEEPELILPDLGWPRLFILHPLTYVVRICASSSGVLDEGFLLHANAELGVTRIADDQQRVLRIH